MNIKAKSLNAKGSISGNITPRGKDGESAYEIAVRNGFEGTEAEWIESLEGGVGESVEGREFTPFTVDEANDCAYIYDDESVTAGEGAEIFNDYDNIAAGNWATASGHQTQALGNFSIANGWWTRADGQCAVASGLLTRASGHFTHAEGTRTLASINNAHAEGDLTQATGRQAHSEGVKTIASGYCAHAEGSETKATNYYSHAEGYGTIAAGRNQTAMGKFNISDTSSLVIVGNGSKDTTRSNAYKLDANGNGWFEGTVASTGADYAEYFEWADGNPDGEDRIGRVVTLDGDKIRFANENDYIVGIVSGTALILGDNPGDEWKHKFLKDEYGRFITETVEDFIEYFDYETGTNVTESTGLVTRKVLNPEFNPDDEYLTREERNEWEIVGMMGKLHVIDDGTCVVNSYAKVSHDGIVTHSDEVTTMRVMERISDNIILVLKKTAHDSEVGVTSWNDLEDKPFGEDASGEVKTLDEKFIPNSIARVTDIPSSEGFATETYVNDKVAEALSDIPSGGGSMGDMDQLASLIETDMLPAIHNSEGKILTDELGRVILRY